MKPCCVFLRKAGEVLKRICSRRDTKAAVQVPSSPHHHLLPAGSETLHFIICFHLWDGKQESGVFRHNADLLAHITCHYFLLLCFVSERSKVKMGLNTCSVQDKERCTVNSSLFLYDYRNISAFEIKSHQACIAQELHVMQAAVAIGKNVYFPTGWQRFLRIAGTIICKECAEQKNRVFGC